MNYQFFQRVSFTVLYSLSLFLLAACFESSESPTLNPALFANPPATEIQNTESNTTSVAPVLGFSELESGQIMSQALQNNLIGDPSVREYLVYLPPSYFTTDKNYPVVYVLHGFAGDEWSLISISDTLDSMLAQGVGREMILVFVNGDNRFGGSWYHNSPTIGDYETYIVYELVSQIDSTYRTFPNKDSRGITGCSMGGDGALHLALMYPDVISVAVPMSAGYNFESKSYPWWEMTKVGFRKSPKDFDDFAEFPQSIQWFIAGAAAGAPNPDKPPFFLDMPFEVIDGEGYIVQEVREKVNRLSPLYDLDHYLNLSTRLQGLLLYHGVSDPVLPVELAREFDNSLTEFGIEHDYVETQAGHCDLNFSIMLQFMADKLAFE